MSFSIIADSCCDFTPEMRIDPIYRSIPLTIHVGGVDYVDNQNLDTSLLICAGAERPHIQFLLRLRRRGTAGSKGV